LPSCTREKVITATPLPNTPGPTPTPTNTSTPIPTATPVVVEPFEDDFSQPNATWTIAVGDPIWTNGVVVGNEETWMCVGDPQWEDYIVDVEMGYVSRSNDIVVGVRAKDIANMVIIAYWNGSNGALNWKILENGQRNTIPETTMTDLGNPAKISLQVEGDQFCAESPGGVQSCFFNSQYPSGPVCIGLYGNDWIDNFSVRPIEE
jgi:hypothetical protein